MTELTLIFEEGTAELPGANTQGESLEEVRENLNEAVELILTSNQEAR